MSKILVVPDVHGRIFWHKAKELVNDVDKIVFLGDYLDPYDHEKITFNDAIKEFKLILEFKDKYPDKVILLIGNHCMHYVIKEFMNCSRLNIVRRDEIHKLYNDNIDKFQLIYLSDNYLFSHAGFYLNWVNKYKITLEELLDFKKFLKERWNTLEDFSYFRCGIDSVGSCIWADIRESLSNELLPNIQQIVGHTMLKNPYISQSISCLDVQKCFILNTETKEINEIC